jgi:YVTN family beta-propeller protein
MRTAVILLAAAAALTAQPLQLIVGQKVSGTVGFYGSEGEQLASVPVGKHPHEIALSPDGQWAYVSDNGILWMTDPGEGGNTISIIDVRRWVRAGVIDLGKYRRPHGIDIDNRTGRLFVTVENPDGLLSIDPKQKKILRAYDVKGDSPHMVKLDAAGEWAYVSNTHSSTLAAVNLATGATQLIAVGARPQGATLSKDGRLIYLTNSDGNSISIIDTASKRQVGTIPTGQGPGRVALTADGRRLVYNLQKDNALGFADLAKRVQTHVVALPGPPLSLHLDPSGETAYTGVQSLDKVVAVSVKDAKIVRIIDTPKGSGPDAVVPMPIR